ncbi:MAG: hypothetical protein ACQEXJ_09545 [Myxococcota bacterium]
MRLVFLAAALALSAGCLDPLVSDEVVAEGLVRPADAEIPTLYEAAPDLDAQVREATGLEPGETVPLRSAFAGGEPVRFWDLGPAPAASIPIYVLSVEHGDGTWDRQPDHPTLIDSIPGDAGYSPFWQVVRLPVTDAYAGERIVSFAAVQEARERGLVGEPIFTDVYVNCSVVPDSVRLEVREGREEVGLAEAYYRGRRVSYLALATFPLADDGVRVAETPLYRLRREGGEPLDEAVRGVDMTGDGDLDDTNHVFGLRRGDEGYSPLARFTDVAVAAGTEAVDTRQDDAASEVMGVADLFDDGVPRAERVVALHPTDDRCNCPQELPE